MRYLSLNPRLATPHTNLAHNAIYGFLLMMSSANCLGSPGSSIGAYTEVMPGEATDKFDVFVADQMSYDTNLFRLPQNSQELGLAPVKARADWINLASAGVEGEWVAGLQDVQFNVHADDDRFDRNTDLNNTAGGAHALWNWRVGSLFLGDLGADYSRHLAGFAATGYLGRDLVGRTDYFADARYQLGPRWAVFGGVAGADTSNSAPALEGNDGHAKSGNAGVELATSVDKAIGFEYRYTDGHYSFNEESINGVPFNRDYQDNSGRGYVKYAITDKTTFIGSAGYLKRTYLNSTVGAFSGEIWSLSVQWQATDKTLVTFTALRDLDAYVDAQSDYFVSQGFIMAATWSASEKLTLKSSIAWHDLNYISSSPTAVEVHSRHDKTNYDQVELIYSVTSALTLDIACHYDQRASNQEVFKYDDTLITASVTFKFL